MPLTRLDASRRVREVFATMSQQSLAHVGPFYFSVYQWIFELCGIYAICPTIQAPSCQRKLQRRVLRCHQLATKFRPVLQLGEIPAEVFACDSHSGVFAVEGVEVGEVRLEHPEYFCAQRWCHLTAGREVVLDLAKYPGPALGGAAVPFPGSSQL